MTRRWHWDFEDERRPARPPAPEAPPPVPPQPPPAAASRPAAVREAVIRRRRFAAALIVVAVLVIAVAAITSSHHKTAAKTGQTQLAATAHVRAHPPTEPENDQRQAVSSVLAYTPFVRHGGTRGNEVALTFDDGPGPYTPQILSLLERMRVHATFFAIGRMERYFSASTAREIEDGDVVGDHTEDHSALAHLSAHDQHEQLLEQILRIELLGGQRPMLFRPPYGSFDATTMRELHHLHLLMVLWSVDTNDYLRPGVQTIVQRALGGATPGAIILMHDGGGDRSQTIEALPLIIRGLRARGLRPVTVPRLLMDDPPAAGEPLPPSLAGD
jgi:peptidoglycan/xylan/chitin deacetylase (PgdA/CDA1 family)